MLPMPLSNFAAEAGDRISLLWTISQLCTEFKFVAAKVTRCANFQLLLFIILVMDVALHQQA